LRKPIWFFAFLRTTALACNQFVAIFGDMVEYGLEEEWSCSMMFNLLIILPQQSFIPLLGLPDNGLSCNTPLDPSAGVARKKIDIPCLSKVSHSLDAVHGMDGITFAIDKFNRMEQMIKSY
jgi:hypothetical protein